MTFDSDRLAPAFPARRLPLVRVLVAATLLVFAAGLAQDAAQVPDDADAILDRMVENLRGGGQRATLEMRVERDDDVREYRLEVISDGTERSLTRVAGPPRDAGQAFLVDGDELFVYSPRLGRALRLPPSGRSDGFGYRPPAAATASWAATSRTTTWPATRSVTTTTPRSPSGTIRP